MDNRIKMLCWAGALLALAFSSRIFPTHEANFDAAFYAVLALAVVTNGRNCNWRRGKREA